jgi:pimeloyl-ACP methyl ester carboxylesterase
MIDASLPTYRRSIRPMTAIDGSAMPVTLSGPVEGRVVIMLEATPPGTDSYDTIRERLHVAMFRTVVIRADKRLTAKSVVGLLDQLKIAGGLLVGDGVGGELAWKLAAAYRERFTGLVVVDCGHPRVPTMTGVIHDKDCPAVELDTTVLVSTRAAHFVAYASRRHVHAEFRLVELAGPRSSRHFTAQLATEIVVRALAR